MDHRETYTYSEEWEGQGERIEPEMNHHTQSQESAFPKRCRVTIGIAHWIANTYRLLKFGIAPPKFDEDITRKIFKASFR